MQPGDTLAAVAQSACGNAQRWRGIAVVNGIRDPSMLQPGMTLVLPWCPTRRRPRHRPISFAGAHRPREPHRARGGPRPRGSPTAVRRGPGASNSRIRVIVGLDDPKPWPVSPLAPTSARRGGASRRRRALSEGGYRTHRWCRRRVAEPPGGVPPLFGRAGAARLSRASLPERALAPLPGALLS